MSIFALVLILLLVGVKVLVTFERDTIRSKDERMTDQNTLHQETHLKVLRLLEVNPQMTQRYLAAALGVSLGKTNFCLKALLDKGLLKVQNFQSNKRKLAYAYFLTPAGIAEKTALAGRFLKCKIEEYELLRAEIEALQQETDASVAASQVTLKPRQTA